VPGGGPVRFGGTSSGEDFAPKELLGTARRLAAAAEVLQRHSGEEPALGFRPGQVYGLYYTCVGMVRDLAFNKKHAL
jgi:hypothetical protein